MDVGLDGKGPKCNTVSALEGFELEEDPQPVMNKIVKIAPILTKCLI